MNPPAGAQYDLREQVRWVPVRYLDGHREHLGLQALLEQAHLIDDVDATPLEWAALMRFLPSVMALIAREDPGADWDEWARSGIPAEPLTRALDTVAERLWLRHPDTPFLQEPLLCTTGGSQSTEWLHLLAPARSTKAWWGKPGDAMPATDPARLARGLVVSWYFNPGVSGKAAGAYMDAPDVRWRPRGSLGAHNHGLRVFHRGENLAATMLANTMGNHVHTHRGANLPLWVVPGDTSPAAGTLTASTWTGSVYLLGWDEGGVCTGVHVGGRRFPGYSADPDQRKKQTLAVEADLWRADPTIPRVPVMQAGERTGQVRPLRALHPLANSVQWAAEWYAADARRASAHPMEPGLIDTDRTALFTIRVDGPRTAPEISHFARVGEHTELASQGARARLLSLSRAVLTPIRTALYAGLNTALGAEAARPLQDRLFALFCVHVEELLDEVIHDTQLRAEHAQRFTATAYQTFEQFLTPYLNSRTLGGQDRGIAVALARTRTRLNRSLRSPTTGQPA